MDQFTQSELNKKYGHTYAKILYRGSSFFVFIRGIQDGVVTVDLYSDNGSVRNSFELNEVEICPTPESQVFECGCHVICYTHRPERQWRVGVNADNSRFDYPMYKTIEQLAHDEYYTGRSYKEYEGWNLKGLFFPEDDRTISQGIKALGNKQYAKTLNKEWFISWGLEPDTHLLWYFDTVVGVIHSLKSQINLLFPEFKQEVLDLTHRTGEYYAVE